MTFLDWFATINGIAATVYMFVMARYYWQTRRIIPRRDAPTRGRWLHPAPWR